MELISQRLIIRPWRDADRAPFAAMSADPQVMEFLPPLTAEAASLWIDWHIAHLRENGFCFWAVEARETGIFIGTVGLARVKNPVPFAPAMEVGWRIAHPFWGQGYAPEAAARIMQFGFEALNLSEIVAYTVPANQKSRRVMEKLNMTRNPEDDFEHPALPEGHRLRPHVLYRLARHGLGQPATEAHGLDTAG